MFNIFAIRESDHEQFIIFRDVATREDAERICVRMERFEKDCAEFFGSAVKFIYKAFRNGN
jgi:hypothetical protein